MSEQVKLKPLQRAGKILEAQQKKNFLNHQQKVIEEVFKRKHIEEESYHFLVTRTINVTDEQLDVLVAPYRDKGWTVTISQRAITFRKGTHGIAPSKIKKFAETDRYDRLIKKQEKAAIKRAEIRDEITTLVTLVPDILLYRVRKYLLATINLALEDKEKRD